MRISTSKGLVAVLLLTLPPAAGMAQDTNAVLDSVRKGIGNAPKTLRISAAGSGYAAGPGNAGSRQHFRIETYTLEVDLASSTISERLVRKDAAGGDEKVATRDAVRTANADSPWSDQYLLWTATPHGFLAGASSRSATVATETLLGTTYRVVLARAAGATFAATSTAKTFSSGRGLPSSIQRRERCSSKRSIWIGEITAA